MLERRSILYGHKYINGEWEDEKDTNYGIDALYLLHNGPSSTPFDIAIWKERQFKAVQVKYREAINGEIDVKFSTCLSLEGITRLNKR